MGALSAFYSDSHMGAAAEFQCASCKTIHPCSGLSVSADTVIVIRQGSKAAAAVLYAADQQNADPGGNRVQDRLRCGLCAVS